MKPKILLVAVLAVIGIIVMSGCIGEKETGPKPGPPVNQTQAEVKEPSIDEIIGNTKTVIDGINTYEFESTNRLIKSDMPEEETITGNVDRANKKKYYLSSSVEIAVGEEILIETSSYVIKDITYMNIAGAAWFKHETEWIYEDILGVEKNLLKNASLYDIGKFEGEEAYILQLGADKSIFEEIFILISIIDEVDVEEMINNAEDVNVKLWVSKDTFLPLKEYRTVKTKLKGESLKIEIETKFKNYNTPQNIKLPKEAESAEDVMAEEKIIENPKPVGKTIEAIDNVTSYKLGIKKEITGIVSERETNEIDCDRVNKRLININRFTVEEGGESEYVAFAIYTIDNLNFYEYSGIWFKSDTKWSDDDFLEIIKNLLKKTKVEVAEENNSWIFDVKTNKDVFSGDFGELAAGASNPEVAVDELNLNAENVVVKIWVAKDTFLPVKEVMSIESKYGGSKMTINKEFNFKDYNVPVRVNLPYGAKDAEKIE